MVQKECGKAVKQQINSKNIHKCTLIMRLNKINKCIQNISLRYCNVQECEIDWIQTTFENWFYSAGDR